MKTSFEKALNGYQAFREKYASGDESVMDGLSREGQQPQMMVVACCDARVDPAVILQCDPGDLFVVRNVANIVPPYEKDDSHHGTSAALEFGVRVLKVKHLVVLGHSQCGGIQTLLNKDKTIQDDFITNWVSLIQTDHTHHDSVDECAKYALNQSYENCLTFPWIQEKLHTGELKIHLWFFDIKAGQIYTYNKARQDYVTLEEGEE